MSLTIVASFLQAHCRSATSFLENAGLMPPQISGDTTLDPIALTSKMRAALIKNPADGWAGFDFAQVGKAWQIKAADLIVANADQPCWGWGDSDVLPFLEFWARFEPNSRFALFYSDPGAALRAQYSSEFDGDPRTVADKILRNWHQYNDGILRFYNSFPDRCILANISSIIKRRADLNLNIVNKLYLKSVLDSFESDLDLKESDAILLRAMRLVDYDSGPVKLFAELEATANCQGDRGSNEPPDLIELFVRSEDAHRRLCRSEQSAADLSEALDAARQERDALAVEREQLSDALDSARRLASEALAKSAEWESSYGVVAGERDRALARAAVVERLERQASDLASELAEAEVRLATMADQFSNSERARMSDVIELKAMSERLEMERSGVAQTILQQRRLEVENELLSLQLDQAKEELQHQYAELIELKAKVAYPIDQSCDAALAEADDARALDVQRQYSEQAAPGSSAAAVALAPASRGGPRSEHTVFTMDLRQPIDGTDWYEPEDDGRWAGPGTRSSLILPSFGPGKYRIAVTIVDGMSRSGVLGLKLAIGGTDLRARLTCRADLDGLYGKMKQLKAQFDASVSPFPVIASAEIEIRDGVKHPLRMFLEFPEAMSPAATGSEDNRILTARIAQVRLERML